MIKLRETPIHVPVVGVSSPSRTQRRDPLVRIPSNACIFPHLFEKLYHIIILQGQLPNKKGYLVLFEEELDCLLTERTAVPFHPVHYSEGMFFIILKVFHYIFAS